jgi:hypothetical protein
MFNAILPIGVGDVILLRKKGKLVFEIVAGKARLGWFFVGEAGRKVKRDSVVYAWKPAMVSKGYHPGDLVRVETTRTCFYAEVRLPPAGSKILVCRYNGELPQYVSLQSIKQHYRPAGRS